MKDLENHMVLPYADDEPIPEPAEPEFERDTSLVDVLKDIATGLGEDFMKKEQAE